MTKYLYDVYAIDHGYGGPYDATRQLVAKFSTKEKVHNFMQDKKMKLLYVRGAMDGTCGAWYPMDGKNYLGIITYDVSASKDYFICDFICD